MVEHDEMLQLEQARRPELLAERFIDSQTTIPDVESSTTRPSSMTRRIYPRGLAAECRSVSIGSDTDVGTINSPCIKKLMRPVAMTGLPIQMYQFIHHFSKMFNDEGSRPVYRSAPYGKVVAGLNAAMVALPGFWKNDVRVSIFASTTREGEEERGGERSVEERCG